MGSLNILFGGNQATLTRCHGIKPPNNIHEPANQSRTTTRQTLLGSSGTGFFGCSCLPKAVTGVSQPGVGLESAYSGPRVELRPPVYPSPVFRADLALVGAVHPGGGGNQRRRGYRVGDCSAEGGTRLGCVRGALGSICFITRLARIPLYCTPCPEPWSPSTTSASPTAPSVPYL